MNNTPMLGDRLLCQVYPNLYILLLLSNFTSIMKSSIFYKKSFVVFFDDSRGGDDTFKRHLYTPHKHIMWRSRKTSAYHMIFIYCCWKICYLSNYFTICYVSLISINSPLKTFSFFIALYRISFSFNLSLHVIRLANMTM